jgi:CBS domain-containing protein
MKARDIMTPNPDVVTPEDSIQKAAQIMRDSNVGMVPVVDDVSKRTLQGVLTDRDIVIRHVAGDHDSSCLVRDHMTAERVDTARLDDDVREVVARMEREQVRRIPVVGDGFRLEGVIAQADVALRMGEREPLLVKNLVEKVSERTPGS